ncbi:MAG: hypothetical protein B6I23_01180 [Rickettsiaceae bacterium 4572_127]|nr:MAG: hypothetical protein B6I23_01180 [Rickettsiaceae bacterium 4572_127]
MTNITGRNNVQQEYQEVDKEEQLLGMEETKKRWGVCMDDFCNDTDSINPAYRCLCSANIAKLKPLEKKVHEKMKQLLQLTSNVEAAKMGIQYQIFNEATLEKLGLTEDENDTENPWDLDNVNYGLDQLLGEENKRKEGLALFKDSLGACDPYLKLSASFKKHIVASYQASTQKSCLAFQNSLTGKLRKMEFVFQSAYNKLQKAEHKEANQFSAEECSKQVKNVLITTAGCGENFENCQTKALLESKRIIVSDILDKCKNVNKNDVIWKEIVGSGKRESKKHSKSLVSQCATDLKDCMQPHCGNGFVDCATSNDIEYKKNYCLVKLDPCLNDKNKIWSQFKKEAIKFGKKTLKEISNRKKEEDAENKKQNDTEEEKRQREAKITQCEADKTNFKSCVNMRCEGKWSECAGTPSQCSTETFGKSCETAEKTNLVTSFNNKITSAVDALIGITFAGANGRVTKNFKKGDLVYCHSSVFGDPSRGDTKACWFSNNCCSGYTRIEYEGKSFILNGDNLFTIQ